MVPPRLYHKSPPPTPQHRTQNTFFRPKSRFSTKISFCDQILELRSKIRVSIRKLDIAETRKRGRRRRALKLAKRKKAEKIRRNNVQKNIAELEKVRPIRKHARDVIMSTPLPLRKRKGFILELLYDLVDSAIDRLVKRDVKLYKLRTRRSRVYHKAREHYYRGVYKVAIEQAAEIARNIIQQRQLELLEGLACHPDHAQMLAWAATEVQRRYRGRIVRRQLRENPPIKYNKMERERRDKAAIAIQSLGRGYIARCSIDPIQRMIYKLWKYFDQDKDGSLNTFEFLQFANNMLASRIYKLDENEASRFVRFLDKDGDNLVSKDELSKFLRNGIDMDEDDREDFISRSTTHAKLIAAKTSAAMGSLAPAKAAMMAMKIRPIPVTNAAPPDAGMVPCRPANSAMMAI